MRGISGRLTGKPINPNQTFDIIFKIRNPQKLKHNEVSMSYTEHVFENRNVIMVL